MSGSSDLTQIVAALANAVAANGVATAALLTGEKDEALHQLKDMSKELIEIRNLLKPLLAEKETGGGN